MKKTYLTEEERMKIIEEEKLRNEIRNKKKREEVTALEAIFSLTVGLLLIAFFVFMFLRINNIV